MQFKTLGDGCKWFEKNFSPEIMIPELPVIIRIDGNNFSKWTKGLEKPFDEGLNNLMVETTKALVKETNAIIGYHQSDEITLILYSKSVKSAIYNDGKKQKILSKLTGFVANYFNSNRPTFLPNHNKIANFDCRIYQVPNLHWATNQLLWRENDATKNSIAMLAQSLKLGNLDNLNGSQLQDLMMEKRNVNWNDLPTKYKRGSYVMRFEENKPISKEELDSLPEKHNLRKNPDQVFKRNVIKTVELPIMSTITNRAEFIFNRVSPTFENESGMWVGWWSRFETTTGTACVPLGKDAQETQTENQKNIGEFVFGSGELA